MTQPTNNPAIRSDKPIPYDIQVFDVEQPVQDSKDTVRLVNPADSLKKMTEANHLNF